MQPEKPFRTIRSFVRREGRLTPSQQRAIETLWPHYAIDDASTLLDLNEVFGRSAPKIMEIGFGNGASLAQMAAAQPEQDFLGIEVHRPGVGQLLKLIDKYSLCNLRIACTDAVELLKNRIADNALDRVHIFFPDPWHKKRHHKRRLIQAEFVALLAQKIKPGGYLHLATDWEDYACQMRDILFSHAHFENCGNKEGFIARPDYRPLTKFEKRGQKLGHGVWDLLFQCHKNEI